MKINTQVGIIGAGPSGLLLANWLKKHGISSVIIELRSREYLEGRVRAGLVEQNTKDILKQLGLDARLKKEGVVHDGVYLSFEEERIRIPFAELTDGRTISIYGQQEITKDLIDAWLQDNGALHFETKATKIVDFDTKCPKIYFEKDG